MAEPQSKSKSEPRHTPQPQRVVEPGALDAVAQPITDAEQIVALQRSIGNRATTRLLTGASAIQRNGDLSKIHQIAGELAPGDRTRSVHLIAILQRFSASAVRAVFAEAPDVFSARERAFLVMDCVEETDSTAADVGKLYAALPQAFAGKAVALAVLDFIRDGGSYPVARFGLGSQGGDPVALGVLLTKLLPLCRLAPGTDFTDQQLTLILTYEDTWRGSDNVLMRLKNIVLDKSAEEAVDVLERTKAFGFDTDFTEAAESASDAYANTEAEATLRDITEREKAAIAKAIAEQEGPTDSERLKMKRKLKTDSKVEEAIKQFKAEKSKAKTDLISQGAQGERDEVAKTLIPEKKALKREEYRSYSQQSRYHPRALEVLSLVRTDFVLAGKIMAHVNAQPSLTAVLIDAKLEAAVLDRIVAAPAPELVTLVNLLTLPEFKKYAAGNGCFALLRALVAGGVSAPKCKALAAHVESLNTTGADPTATGHLITLLNQMDVPQFVAVIKAIPSANRLDDPTKMADAVTLIAHAQTPEILVIGLQICRKVKWGRPKILAVIGALGGGLGQATLSNGIYDEIIAQYPRGTQFVSWLNNISVLLDEGYVYINYGAVELKPHKNLNILEVWVEYTSNNGYVDDSTFYAHTHPKAEKAKVGSAHASRGHLKPENDDGPIRVKAGSVPENIRTALPKEEIGRFLA